MEETLRQAWTAQAEGNKAEAERLYRQALKSDPDSPIVAAAFAAFFRQSHRKPDAERLLRRALKSNPDHPVLKRELGLLHLASRRFDQAFDLLTEVVDELPESAESWHALGSAHLATQNHPEAIRTLTRAHELNPDNIEIRLKLGTAHQMHGSYPEAIPHLEAAHQANPGVVGIMVNLGELYRLSGRFDEALTLFDRALEHQPDLGPALAAVAEIHETLGHHDRSAAIVDEAIAKPNPHPAVVAAYSRIARRRGRHADAIEPIKKALSKPERLGPQATRLFFEFGWVLERTGDFDNAFKAYSRANQLLGRQWFKSEGYEQYVNAFIETFTADRVAAMRDAGRDSDLPVFVMGMPRSGTSLVEQILAAHPSVHPGGELTLLPAMTLALPTRIGADKPYPLCVESLSPEVVGELADEYLAALREIGPEADRVTDKMLQNYLHMGLIAMMFPKARIIHCVRNPLDTCFSIFATMLPAGVPFSNDLSAIASAYVQYRRIMDHWRSLNIPMLDVSYEDLIADQGEQSRRIVEFAGLDWDDACLRFHEAGYITKTASADQVRQPIYTSSIGRHERFAQHLAPLREPLAQYL
jgi:tetratricopeptide (TPR) repeat protein